MIEFIAAAVLFFAGVSLLSSKQYGWGSLALGASIATLAPGLFSFLADGLVEVLAGQATLIAALLGLLLSAYALRKVIGA